MRKYERAQRIRAAVKTLVGCIGWGLLGYLMMIRLEGLFWPGWLVMTTALLIGAYAVDRLIETI